MKTALKSFHLSSLLVLLAISACSGNHPAAEFAKTYSPPLSGGARLHVNVDVKEDGSYVVETEEWQSPHSPDAIAHMGQQTIHFRDGAEIVEVLEAYTLKRNGERREVAQDRILTQQPPVISSAPMYGDMRVKTLIFPDVEVGDYIVYHTRVTHKTADFPGHYSNVFVFPRSFLMDDVRITYRFPKQYPLHFDARGMVLASQRDEGKYSERTWAYQNLKPVAAEAGGVDPFDRDARLIVSSFQTWRDFASIYEAMSKNSFTESPAIRQLAERLTQGLTTPRAQAEALYRWVSLNIRYVAIYLGAGGYIPHKDAEVLDNRYGDCKDHATLLEALLAAKGIESTPVLINTNPRYTTADLPFVQSFNHMILYVPSLDLFLDATAGVLPFGALSPAIADKPVLLVRGDKTPIRTTPSMSAMDNAVESALVLNVAVDGETTGRSLVKTKGAFALPLRSLMLRSNGNPGASFFQSQLNQYGLYGSGQLNGDKPQTLSDPYVLRVELRLADFLSHSGAQRIPSGLFSPHPIGALANQLNTAFATVDHPCVPQTLEEAVTLNFPATTAIDRVPDDVHFANAITQYDAIYTLRGHTLNAARKLIISPTANTCSPVEMNQLRKLAEVVHNDTAAQIFYR